jgi:hypothetical protein
VKIGTADNPLDIAPGGKTDLIKTIMLVWESAPARFERFFKIKQSRRVATRYDHARSQLSGVHQT